MSHNCGDWFLTVGAVFFEHEPIREVSKDLIEKLAACATDRQTMPLQNEHGVTSGWQEFGWHALNSANSDNSWEPRRHSGHQEESELRRRVKKQSQ